MGTESVVREVALLVSLEDLKEDGGMMLDSNEVKEEQQHQSEQRGEVKAQITEAE